SFRVGKGEIVSLIGANGAGKTTTLRAVSGVVAPRKGSIAFSGKEIAGLPAHIVARLGIAHVPEGRGMFPAMTVMENLQMGAYARAAAADFEESLTRAFALFPRLRERARQPAGTLSGGEQQMLAIGRALVARPELMLLDEPSMGLSPLLVSEIFGLIAEINREGGTILLVEQNASMALSVAHRAYVLENGRVALEGTAAEMREDPKVRAAYFGDAAD
ncbi:MAG: ABC transporter ATP-binding protein, partial [Deltaproteobacteria bacterium]|nr:ABC transporter ATP-binding protein [Deltaproteobacteria bacterium]